VRQAIDHKDFVLQHFPLLEDFCLEKYLCDGV